ncbi:Rv1733c family protein [Blastococcus sp. SYSU D00695]
MTRPGTLTRGTDRVQALSRRTAVLLVVLSVPLAWVLGAAAADGIRARTAEEAAERTRVTAVLLEDAREGLAPPTGVAVPATWTAPDGSRREGEVRAGSDAHRGRSLSIWVDGHGDLVPAPLPAGLAPVQGVVAGLLVVGFAGALGAGAHAAVCRALDRRRDRQWTAGWARVEPLWAGRASYGDP